ncbi:MAG TPA: lysophospholipid acyltransferase family protein [Gemmatimonadaceae bacterium]|nr:lysophospholipid acyltransferase family protein [Gemmatimonadaceae bacterium]
MTTPAVPPTPARVSFAHRAEYAAFRAVIKSLGALDWRRAGDIGASIGALGYRPLGIRRLVVERQIAAAFPGLGKAGVTKIARAAYEHLGRSSIEAATLPGLGRDAVFGAFEGIDNYDVIETALSKGRGLILATGHLGNWELGGVYLAARGLPIDVIVRRMNNPLFDRYLTKTRSRFGIQVVHDAEAVRRTPRALREGRAVVVLADQGVLGLASTFVPFFGRPAKTPRGPAVFALRLNVPVVFGAAIRQPSGKYRIVLESVEVEDTGDRDRDVDAVVARYTATLERWVRRYPEQYFWHHRRWRRQPPGTPPELAEP